MHVFGLVLFGFIAFFWLTHGIRVCYGAIRLPWLKRFTPAADPDCPRISLIFAARDEEEKLPAALATLMEIDYPNLEVIAVDDRSNDATRRILDDYAAAHPRLGVVHVMELPPGWLGKPHALQKAYEIGFTLAQAFVREEEKCLVFLDGASEGETRLKPPKWGIDRRSVRAEREWVAGIQFLIAPKAEDIAMPCVRARL